MPNITTTTISLNSASLDAHRSFARDYVLSETEAGRMSGPFTCSEIDLVCGGAFHCSPYLVVVRPGATGEPDKRRLCINLSKVACDHCGGKIPSVNDHIDPDEFITRFDSAAVMADKVQFVSQSSPIIPTHSYPPST
jgi:hypothetical protein